MKTTYGVLLKSGKNVILYTETSLDDYLASSLLNLVSDKTDPEVEKFLELNKQLSKEYYVSVRLCTFNVVEFTSISK